MSPAITTETYQDQYFTFMERFRQIKDDKPKIVITSLILAEVINRYLRDIGFAKFCAKHNLDKSDKDNYKNNYRDSEDFLRDYRTVCEDINAYAPYSELVPDGFGDTLTLDHLLKDPQAKLDFNDQYYCLLAKHHRFTIVTHDVDFFVEDIEILTGNGKLYRKYTDQIRPISILNAKASTSI